MPGGWSLKEDSDGYSEFFTPLSVFDKSSPTAAGLTQIIRVNAAEAPPGPDQPLKKHFSWDGDEKQKYQALGLHSPSKLPEPHPRPPTPGLSAWIRMTGRRTFHALTCCRD